MLRAYIAIGYIPRAWRRARVMFIPKAGRSEYICAKNFKLICLTSFMLKTLKKLVDVYMRDVVLLQCPLHLNQHAYRAGYSMETALHSAVSIVGEQLEKISYAVGVSLDIEYSKEVYRG